MEIRVQLTNVSQILAPSLRVFRHGQMALSDSRVAEQDVRTSPIPGCRCKTQESRNTSLRKTRRHTQDIEKHTKKDLKKRIIQR